MNKSAMFLNSKPGTKGRRATRWLDDNAVARAIRNNEDIDHRLKFMTPMKRFATILALSQ